MALEAELARLYFKSRGIDAGLAAVRDGTHPPWAGPIPKPSGEELEEELRKLGPIDEKIEAVSLFLDPRGIDEFAQQSESDKTLHVAGDRGILRERVGEERIMGKRSPKVCFRDRDKAPNRTGFESLDVHIEVIGGFLEYKEPAEFLDPRVVISSSLQSDVGNQGRRAP